MLQAFRDKKNSKEWMQCLCSNLVDRLFTATSQSTNYRRLQTLRLHINQLSLIREPTKTADLHPITGIFEGNNVRVLELNVSPRFALMNQVVLNINSTQSTMSSSSSNNKACF